MPEQPENRQLAGLIDEGVVREDRNVDQQGQLTLALISSSP
jgi:hypothetical protein